MIGVNGSALCRDLGLPLILLGRESWNGLQTHRNDGIAISVVVGGELRFMVQKSQRQTENLQVVTACLQFIASLNQLPAPTFSASSASQAPILTQLVEPSCQCSFFQIGALCFRVSIAY